MKKILLILFVLIFNFSYGLTDAEEDYLKKMDFQLTSFIECSKLEQDHDELVRLVEDFKLTHKKFFNRASDKNRKEYMVSNEDVLLIVKGLEELKKIESKLDHMLYYHGLEFRGSDFIMNKKDILEKKTIYEFYMLGSILYRAMKKDFSHITDEELNAKEKLEKEIKCQAMNFTECLGVHNDLEEISVLIDDFVVNDIWLIGKEFNLTPSEEKEWNSERFKTALIGLSKLIKIENKLDHMFYHHSFELQNREELIASKRATLEKRDRYERHVILQYSVFKN